jgi:hypothetical protein
MDNKNIVLPAPNEEEVNISLPIKKKDLGNFICDLLGQQQTIERDIDDNFDIDHAWLINLHELIHQRIYQQADANLASFSAVIYFKKGLKRSFTTVNSLKNYTETKKDIPVGIKIIWIYLIQFPSKKYPEKQQITFSAHIHSKSEAKSNSNKNKLQLETLFLDTFIRKSERSFINFQINHTERTWGDDIEVIMTKQLDEAIRDDQLLGSLFNSSRLIFVLMILLFSFIYPTYTDISSRNDIMSTLMENYNAINISGTATADVIIEKLDKLAAISVGSKGTSLKPILIAIFGPSIAILILRITRRSTYSFLVLSKESKKDRTKKLKQERRSVFALLWSFIIAVLTGIIANYSYVWVSGL